MKISIWEGTLRGEQRWIVVYRIGGKRMRRYFAHENDAIALRNELGGDPDATGTEWALVPKDRRREYLQAISLALRHGLNLLDCVTKSLGLPPDDPTASAPAPLPTSTPARALIGKSNRKTIKDVAESFVQLKGDAWAPRTRSERVANLRKFVDSMGTLSVDAVTPEMMQEWLNQWPGKRTQQTQRDHASILFNYAIEREWCRKNPCKALAKLTFAQEVPTTFNAATCEAIMREVTPDMIGYFALSMFCGLRRSEVQRAKWSDLDLDRKLIHIPSANALKQNDWRDVDLPDNAIPWLRIAKRNGVKVSPSNSTVDRRQRIIVDRLKLEWDENILRHTAASMMVAIGGKTTAYITDQLGHDLKMLVNHYRARIARTEAEAFYAIMPYKTVEATA